MADINAMANMQIKELFALDIERPIEEVIKVDQDDAQIVQGCAPKVVPTGMWVVQTAPSSSWLSSCSSTTLWDWRSNRSAASQESIRFMT